MIPKKYLLLAGLSLSNFIARCQPITDAQALAAGHAIEKATNSGDPSAVERFLDLDSLAERTRQKSRILKEPGAFDGFKSGFVPSFKGNFGKQIQTSIHDGSYQLLREYDKDGKKHLLFRMFGYGGLNYHDYLLTRVGDSIKAADIYTFLTDSWTSGSIARLADMMGQSGDLEGDAGIIKKMGDEIRKADYTGAKSTYEAVAPEYKKTRSIQMMYITACHHIDLGLYEKALETYAATFPDAASSYLMMLDLFYLQKQYDKALVAIDKLDKIVGGDPLLDFFRGNAYALMGKKAESLGCYEKVYRYDPTLKINVIKLAAIYAESDQQNKAKKVIDAYMQTPAYHPGDLTALYDQHPELR